LGSLHDLSLTALSERLAKREVSSREATEACLSRIEAVEPRVKAFLTVDAEGALASADAADRRRRGGDALSPLLGVPLAIKDNMCTAGLRTTCASKILADFIPPYDAAVVTRLREAGAVVVGKTNLDEFAMGSSTEHSGFQPTRNPWNLDLIPGGSSGGSAAATAAREVPGALGSDTGGSIRQPASHCGVVGLKPTYGRVSRYGLVAFASSLDQIGPVARSVEDVAVLLGAIAGHDPRDSTSADVPVPDYRAALDRELGGVRIGVPREYFVEGIDPEVERAVRGAIEQAAKLGAEVVEISLPHTPYAVSVYYLVATAEASSNLARYDGVHYGHRTTGAENIVDLFSRSRREGFGDEVKRRIMLGTYALSAGYYDAYYLRALRVRTLIKKDFDDAFERVDVIATPTAPTAAFRIGEKMADPLQMYLSDIFTLSCNLAGIPGLCLPCGLTEDRRPIGMQLFAPAFAEERLLGLGARLEAALPPLPSPLS
jgi:aspartyl-tRNA(Asn)/glutamyl-tRNA(Gln) amidotransferase subunit A